MSKILLLSATDLEHGQSHLYDNEIHIIGIGKINAAVNTARLIRVTLALAVRLNIFLLVKY